MTTQQKRRLLLYGFLLSAVHFTLAGLFANARLLLQRPEDIMRSADKGGSPLPYPFADTLERVGDILRLPFDWLWTSWMDTHAPYVFAVLFFAATSCLWGFTLAAVIRFLFTRLRFRHEPRVA